MNLCWWVCWFGTWAAFYISVLPNADSIFHFLTLSLSLFHGFTLPSFITIQSPQPTSNRPAWPPRWPRSDETTVCWRRPPRANAHSSRRCSRARRCSSISTSSRCCNTSNSNSSSSNQHRKKRRRKGSSPSSKLDRFARKEKAKIELGSVGVRRTSLPLHTFSEPQCGEANHPVYFHNERKFNQRCPCLPPFFEGEYLPRHLPTFLTFVSVFRHFCACVLVGFHGCEFLFFLSP
jgi:hypothetical protein